MGIVSKQNNADAHHRNGNRHRSKDDSDSELLGSQLSLDAMMMIFEEVLANHGETLGELLETCDAKLLLQMTNKQGHTLLECAKQNNDVLLMNAIKNVLEEEDIVQSAMQELQGNIASVLNENRAVKPSLGQKTETE